MVTASPLRKSCRSGPRDQLRWKDGAGGQIQGFPAGPQDQDGQTAVPHQQVMKLRWQRIQFLVSVYLLQYKAEKLHFPAEQIHVQLFKMPNDERSDQQTQQKQHHRRNRGEKQRQPKGQRFSSA